MLITPIIEQFYPFVSQLHLLKQLVRNELYNMGDPSSSTSWSNQKDTEDDRMIALMLSEEYTKLDGAVGRRLSNLAPVPVS